MSPTVSTRTTIQEGGYPPPAGVTPNFINPANHCYATIPVGWVLIAIALILIILRVLARFQNRRTQSFKWDDYMAILAVIFGLARVIMVTIEINHFGMCRHIWNIPAENFPMIWHLFDIEDMMYAWAILCAKLSICFFYLNVFGVKQGFRWSVYVVMALTTAYLITTFFTYVFHCGIHTWVGVTDTCLNGITQEIAIGGFNIGTDVLIFLLPIPQIWWLQLSRPKKIGLTLVFALGSFTIVATILREVFAVTTLSVEDQTWNTSQVVLWKTVEMCVGIICSNLLTGPFIVRYLLSTKFGSRIFRMMSESWETSTSRLGKPQRSRVEDRNFQKLSAGIPMGTLDSNESGEVLTNGVGRI